MSTKRTFPEWVADLCDDAQDVVEEVAYSISSVVTTTSPLLATFASGLSVLFAVTDGVGRLLDGRLSNPYLISFLIAVFVMLGMEGTSLASVFNQDRVRAINSTRHDGQKIDEGYLPVWMLLLTMLIVLCTETIPVIVLWVGGSVAGNDLAFAIGLLALPLLGRAGSVIFSNSAMLDGMDGARNRRREERQARKSQRALAKLGIERAEAEMKAELAQKTAAADLNLRLQEAEATAKIGAKYNRSESVNEGVNRKGANRSPRTVNGGGSGDVQAGNSSVISDRDAMMSMLSIYTADGKASARKVGSKVGLSHTKITQLLNRLAELEVVHVESLGKGKGSLVTVNGNHEKFMRGEI